ncbi:MAG: hypothetical protein V1790_18190, partial [Planctomycetota bacterium]
PPCASPREYETERQLMTMSGCVVPRRKSQIISALFLKTYDFAVLKMGYGDVTRLFHVGRATTWICRHSLHAV